MTEGLLTARLILIERRDAKPLLISPRDPAAFIEALRSRI